MSEVEIEADEAALESVLGLEEDVPDAEEPPEEDDAEDETGAKVASVIKPRMTEAVYQEAKELSELGKMNLSQLAAKFGFSKQAFHYRFAKEGVVHGSRAHEVAEAARAAVKAEVEEAARFSARRGLWIEETRLSGYVALKQARMIAQKVIVEAVRDSKFVGGNLDDHMKVLHKYGKLLNENLLTQLELLGADQHTDEQDLPSLIIDDLTDQDILDHHKMTGAMPDDMTIEEMLLEEADDEE